jgi:hypothetical protein
MSRWKSDWRIKVVDGRQWQMSGAHKFIVTLGQ